MEADDTDKNRDTSEKQPDAASSPAPVLAMTASALPSGLTYDTGYLRGMPAGPMMDLSRSTPFDFSQA